MKVILSRKGMDSRAGGIPSPILPDGTLLSLPIPDGTSGKPYGELSYKGQSYQEIIRQLHPSFDFVKNQTCHLDPDIYDGLGGRPAEWKPAFGQCEASARHLDNMGVDVGDVFLFYGMFKQAERQPDGTLGFVRGAPIQHIIYGYMKVGEILREEQEISRRYPWHPHGANTNRPYNNDQLHIERTIFKAKDPDNPQDRWHLDFGPPKTETSKRDIPLHQTAIKLLADVFEQQEQYKRIAGAAYEDNDLVFCTKLGRPQDPINMRRTFYRICNKAGISGFSPHCLRHTFATRGVNANVDVRVMQSFLGHANIQETVNTYTHILPDTAREQMDLMTNVVNY